MALTVQFHNIETDLEGLRQEYSTRLKDMTMPVFDSYKEDIAKLRTALEPYQQYQNILLVANGGSVWSFMAYFTALGDKVAGKNVVPLTDMEPDYLNVIKQKCQSESSIVIVVSKSGSTVGVIENVFALADYQKIFVTDTEGTLGRIAAHYNALVIPHPVVGGRYSGFTCSAYVPSILTGLPIETIEEGGRAGYDRYRDTESSNNEALLVATALYYLESQAYTEVFMPIYSNFLQTFGMVITQLIHESFGKDGKGLTVVAAQAPESQHHTNQRFFGGQRNMIGCFHHVENQKEPTVLRVPQELIDVALRDGTLGDINSIRLADSFKSEYEGTITNAKKQGIPLVDIALSEISGQSVGELMAFWHYVTVYSSLLRGVDPYDQPQVEESKVISFERRKSVPKG